MTFAEYKRRCHGHYKNELRQWQHTRAIAFSFYKMHGGKDPITTFWKLPDDSTAPKVNAKLVEWAQANIKKIKAAYNGKPNVNG